MNSHARPLGIRMLFVLLACLLLASPSIAGEGAKPGRTPSPPSAPTSPEAPAAEAPSDTEPGPDSPVRFVVREGSPDKVAVLSDLDVPAGTSVPGSVICIGGTATIAGKVGGDVVVIAGKLEMTGAAGGDVAGVGSRMIVEDGAVVGKDLVNVAGSLDRGDVRVGGQSVNIGIGGWAAHFPSPFGIFGFFLFWAAFLKLLLVFIGLLLVGAFVPARVQVVSTEFPLHPALAFFVGIGAYILLVMVLVLLCITLIGIPAAILIYFAFVVLKWVGLAGVFHFVGQRIGKGRMSVLGATLLGFLPFALLRFLPFCIGSVIWWVLGAIAFGYVVLTRVGSRPYPGAAAPAPPPAPPAPAV